MTESNNFFELIEWFKKNVDWLNLVLIGGETDSTLIDGVEKPSIDKRFADRFAEIQAMVQGRLSYATKADMDADLNHPANTLAEVWNDPTPENKGLYGKLGASGSGSWLRSDYDLAMQVYELVSQLRNQFAEGFNPIHSIRATGAFQLNRYTKTGVIPSGTPNMQTAYYNVAYTEALSVINNAIANGVYDFTFVTALECTEQISVIFTVVSSKGTYQESLGYYQSGEQKLKMHSFEVGEVVSDIYFSCRWAGTAATDMSVKLLHGLVFSSEAATNARLAEQFRRIDVDKNFFVDKTKVDQNNVYPAIATDESVPGLSKIYRGQYIEAGYTIPVNEFYQGIYFQHAALNGQSFNYVVVIKVDGEFTASQLFNGTWVDLGDGLYAVTHKVSDYDDDNSGHIFKYSWNKEFTTTQPLMITFIDLYLEGAGDDFRELVDEWQAETKNIPTKIFVNTVNQGTYGHEYTNLATVLHSLLDGRENNQYDVNLKGGIYDVTQWMDYATMMEHVRFKQGLELLPYVNLYGEYNTELHCKMSNADVLAYPAACRALSPLNFSGANKLRNITVYAQNCRYAIHDDSNEIKDGLQIVGDCHFEHLGNDADALAAWPSPTAYGSGFPSGKEAHFLNSKIISTTDALTIHTNNGAKRPFEVFLKGCQLISKNPNGKGAAIGLLQTGAHSPKMVNSFILQGNALGGVIKVENSSNPEPFKLVGGGNTPVPVVTKDGVRQVNLLGDQGYHRVALAAVSALDILVTDGAGVRKFVDGDNVALFAGIAQQSANAGDAVPVQFAGYLSESDIGLSPSLGDTLALDNGQFVLNGLNVIGICDWDGYIRLTR